MTDGRLPSRPDGAVHVEGAPSLLLVDDDDVLRARLGRALGERGFEVREAKTTDAARREAERESPEYALVDLRLPDGFGLDLVRDLVALDPTTRVVVLTGYGSLATAVQAVRLGAADYLAKPADADQVARALLGETPGPEEAGPVPSLARVEWEHIQRVLAECQGNISQAARVLGLHRRSLQRKLSKYPVKR